MLAVIRRSQNYLPHRRPLSRGAGWTKFNQLEMVTTFTYKLSLVRIDAHNFNKHTNPHTGPITIHCTADSLAPSVIIDKTLDFSFPSVFGHCWLGDRKRIRPVKSWVVMVCWW